MGKRHSISKVMLMFAWLMLCVNSVFAAWNGVDKEKPARDTKNDKVCIIDTEAKLAWYAVVNKNDNDNNYTKCDAKLTADLDLGGKLWIPIAAGKGSDKYLKNFDGNGHIIKNLYINADELHAINPDFTQNLGFVGVLGGGSVKNLVFENVNIQASTNAGSVLSSKDQQISVGGIVGWMNESKSNIVEKCMVSGIISTTGSGQGVGGIVGNAKKGKITNCLSLVEIRTSGSNAYVGGVIGITKDSVFVTSSVYAGPGLLNIGISNGGSVGGIAGNVFSGNLFTENDYYEGDGYTGNDGVGAICLGNSNKNCKNSTNVNGETVDVDISNQDSVACHLNGMNTDNTCKTEPWSVGETFLSLSGYGTDGYMIVFYANGGTYADGSVAKNKFFDAGMAINADGIVSPSDAERTFMGWALTRDATASAENLGTVSKSDTVFAVWQPKLTVTFNVDPGVFPDDNAQVKTKRVDEGGLVTVGGLGTLPTSYCGQDSAGSCTQWMYFTGWAKNKNSGINDTIGLDTLTAKKDLTLYAVWDATETYTVVYNANGHGKTRVDYVHVGKGEKLTQPQDPIAHDGYVFEKWFTTSSCENGTEFDFNTEITKSITLYAKWTPESYDITYKSVDDDGLVKDFGGEGGPVNSPKNPIEYNIESETINLMAPTPAEGKVFDGWYNDKTFSKKVTRIAKGSFGDRTFYAKWSTKTYRIAYLADNDSYGAVSDQFKVHGESIQLESDGHFRRPGYDEQLGWTNTQNGSVVYDFGAVYTVDAPLILYPAWSEPIVYTITYTCTGCENDPSNPASYTVNTEKELKNPKKLPEGGYKFVGWFTDENYSTRITKIEKGTTGNLTLYCKLNKIYNITYVGADKHSNAKTYTVDDKIQLKDPASREHYTFVGWFDKDGEDGQQVTEIAKGSTGDKTLYARWAAVEYKITYTTNDGTLPDGVENPQIYTIESEDITLPTPSRNGYDFLGWFGEDGKQAEVIEKGTTGDTALFAKWSEPIEYTISYNGVENATNTNPTTYTVESGTILLVAAEKAGYEFEGWYDGENKKVTEIAENSTGNVELTAKWSEPIEYTISYNGVENATNTNPTTYTVESGTIQLVAAEKAGYNFEAWFDKDGKVTKITKGSTGNIVLTAKWEGLIEYTITVNVNGGTLPEGEAIPETYTVETSDITLPTPTKDGYDFIGWYDGENNKIEKIANGSTGNVELTAKWSEPIKYTITVNVDDGTLPEGAAIPETYTVESIITLPIPTKNGFKFDGWYDNDEFNGDAITGIAKGTTGNITLYAKWKIIEYKIVYHTNCPESECSIVNNKGISMDSLLEKPQYYNVLSGFDLPISKSEHYTFGGWYDKENNKIEKIDEGSTGDIELTANWNATKYVISYELKGGTLPDGVENPQTYTFESETFKLPIPTKSGYTFEGWVDQYENPVGEISKHSSGSVTLYANWTPTEYSITYELNGGTLPEGAAIPETYTVESVDITLPIPTKNGYTFEGWYDKENNKIEKIVKGSTGDVVLTAKWSEPIKYTISYNNVENATNDNPDTYTVESDTIQLVDAVKAGYDFAGWFDKDGEEVSAIAKGSTGDIELTAKWEGPNVYKITVNVNGGTLPEGATIPGIYTVETSDITLPIPTKNGYDFIGWYDQENNKIEKMVKGSTGDVELTAKWSAVRYTVTYVMKNGANSQPNVTSYTVEDVAGDKVIDLKPATRCGFEFAGWFKDKDLLGDAVAQIKNGDAENITLYPKWEKITDPEEDYGAVKIYKDKNGLKCAAMDGYFNGTVEISSDVEVSYVTLDREFLVNETAENKLSTIVLPFNIAKSNIVGASFYEMLYVISQNTENQKRGVYISPTNDDVILANKPYIIRTTKANLTFNIDKEANQKVTLNTSESKNTMTDDNQWTLVGMYRYKKWLENDKELGYAYGYTAKSTNKLAAGQFDINEAGAYIVPFRAYLLNVPPKAIAPRPFLAKSASTTTSVNGLPQTASLDVFVIDGSVAQKSEIAEIGETGGKTPIITVKTSPARMKIREGWYDMKGRRLNGKPSAKGIYYYNGKKIRIQ